MNRKTLPAIGMIAGSLLLLEVAFTRYFSFRLWYHYSFLIISVALLGLSASAVALALAQRRGPSNRNPAWAAASSIACAASIMGALPLLALLNEGGVVGAEGSASSFWLVAGYWGVLVLPFFFGGAAISWTISTYGERISSVYAADLLGAAMGVVVAVITLSYFDAEQAMAVAAVLAAAAGVLYVPTWSGRWRLAVLAGVLVGGVATAFATWGSPLSGSTITSTKGLASDLRRGGHLLATRNTMTGRVDVVERAVQQFAWGMGASRPRMPEQLTIRIDGDAMTMVTRRTGPLDDWSFTSVMPSSLPYAMATPRKVLLIGPGGGMDLANALDRAAAEVVGVEVNSGVVDLMTGQLAEFSGNIYRDPRVRIENSDGRNYVEGTTERFDLIQMTLVDTFAAIASGALTLSEDFLYTREAFRAYVDALSDDGYLVLGRTIHEGLSLTALASEALRGRGLELAQHLFIVDNPSSDHSLVFVFKRSPLTAGEIERGRAFAQRARLRVVYAPGDEVAGSEIATFLASPDPAAFIAGFPRDITPETDDFPFYFRSSKWSSLLGTYSPGRGNLLVILGVAVAFGLVFILLPLAWASRGSVHATGWAGAIAYFFFIGLGFIIIELGLMVRFSLFLGHPVRALTVVLAGLLVATGIGSVFSARLEGARHPIRAPVLGAVALAVLYAYGLPRLFPLLMGFDLWARVAISVTLIAPMGVLLGLALPAGIAALRKREDDLILWAWGLNGLASVVGSTLCVLIAHLAGYAAAMLVGAGCYLVAVLLFDRCLGRAT